MERERTESLPEIVIFTPRYRDTGPSLAGPVFWAFLLVMVLLSLEKWLR